MPLPIQSLFLIFKDVSAVCNNNLSNYYFLLKILNDPFKINLAGSRQLAAAAYVNQQLLYVETIGGFIKGILRGVRCTKSLRVLF